MYNINNIRVELNKDEITLWAPVKTPLTHWIAQKGDKELKIPILYCISLSDDIKIIDYIRSRIEPIKYRSKKIRKILSI